MKRSKVKVLFPIGITPSALYAISYYSLFAIENTRLAIGNTQHEQPAIMAPVPREWIGDVLFDHGVHVTTIASVYAPCSFFWKLQLHENSVAVIDIAKF